MPGFASKTWLTRVGVGSAAILVVVGFMITVFPGMLGPADVTFTETLHSFESMNFDANGSLGYLSVLLQVDLSSPLGILGAGRAERVAINGLLNFSLFPAPSTTPVVTFQFDEVKGNHVSVFESQCQPAPYRWCRSPTMELVPGVPKMRSLADEAWFPVGGDYVWDLRFEYDQTYLNIQGNSSKRGEGFVTVDPASVSLQIRSNWNQELFNIRVLGLALIAASSAVVMLTEKIDAQRVERKPAAEKPPVVEPMAEEGRRTRPL